MAGQLGNDHPSSTTVVGDFYPQPQDTATVGKRASA